MSKGNRLSLPSSRRTDGDLSTAQKAQIVADVAEWIAFDWEGCPDKEKTSSAIDEAYKILHIHRETALRNVVCGELIRWAKDWDRLDMPLDRRCILVRGVISAALGRRSYGVVPIAEPSDESIRAAMEAWCASSGMRWAALANLLAEMGFSPIAPDSIRRDWDDKRSSEVDRNSSG